MGIVHPGIPKDLALFLRDTAGIQVFVETGTYMGETAAWASRYFSHVVTIEASETLADSARSRWSELKNIEFMVCESQDGLTQVVPQLSQPTLFWLDAHWSVGNTYGEGHECPLLEEIDVLSGSTNLNLLLIDDARLFLSPPPPPHQIAAWPTIGDVLDAVDRAIPDAYVIITEDVILAVPASLHDKVAAYAQDLAAQHDAARLAALRRNDTAMTRLKRRVKRLVR